MKRYLKEALDNLRKTSTEFQKRNTLYFVYLAVMAGLVASLLSSYISNHILAPSNSSVLYVGALLYTVIGGWVGLGVSLVMARTSGSVVDTRYRKLVFRNAELMKFAALGGMISAIQTGFWLFAFQLYDASLVEAVGSTAIVFILLWDVLKRRNLQLGGILLPTLLVLTGSILSACANSRSGCFSSVANSGQIGLMLLHLLVGVSLAEAVKEQIAQYGAEAQDAVNYTVWRMLFLALTASVFTLVVVISFNHTRLVVDLLTTRWIGIITWVPLAMMFFYFSNSMRASATQELSVTEVNVASSFRVMLALIVTLGLDWVWPGILGLIDYAPMPLASKAAGTILIALALIMLTVKRHRDSLLSNATQN